MSSLVTKNGKVMTFGQYMLLEVFQPKQVDFGSNVPEFNNKSITKNIDGHFWTFINVKDEVYVLLSLAKTSKKGVYEVGFGTSTKPSVDLPDYTEDRLNLNKALRIFNNIFYVLLKMLENKSIEEVYFEPADPKLGIFYTKMVDNKSFVDTLKLAGFKQTSDKYKFTRV